MIHLMRNGRAVCGAEVTSGAATLVRVTCPNCRAWYATVPAATAEPALIAQLADRVDKGRSELVADGQHPFDGARYIVVRERVAGLRAGWELFRMTEDGTWMRWHVRIDFLEDTFAQ